MRLTDDELVALLAGPESPGHERKASLQGRPVQEKVRQTLCAFANDYAGLRRPGVLVVGVDDAGRTTGLPIDASLLHQLEQSLKDGSIVPPPLGTVERREVQGQAVAVVTVAPHPAPPVSLGGTIYVRAGSSTSRARPHEERLLNERRRARDLPFDVQPVRHATLTDLDLDYFRLSYLRRAVSAEVLTENQRPEEHQLRALKLAHEEDGQLFPTVVGVLLLAPDPSFFIPSARVDLIRLPGTRLGEGDELLVKRFTGPLEALVRRIEETLDAQQLTTYDLSGPQEKRSEPYPMRALQELVRNAILHRSYEGTHAPVFIYWFADRIEIVSPGGLYGSVTAERFGQPGVADYRNPQLAAVMRNLGLVQQFGSGLQRARQILGDRLVLRAEETRVVVTVRGPD